MRTRNAVKMTSRCKRTTRQWVVQPVQLAPPTGNDFLALVKEKGGGGMRRRVDCPARARTVHILVRADPSGRGHPGAAGNQNEVRLSWAPYFSRECEYAPACPVSRPPGQAKKALRFHCHYHTRRGAQSGRPRRRVLHHRHRAQRAPRYPSGGRSIAAALGAHRLPGARHRSFKLVLHASHEPSSNRTGDPDPERRRREVLY